MRPLTLEDENGFTFIGLISMIDPPRPEAKVAVATCRKAGIKAGDDYRRPRRHSLCHRPASRMAERPSQVLTGQELGPLDEAQLAQYRVFARVSPEHKVKIVKAFQRQARWWP